MPSGTSRQALPRQGHRLLQIGVALFLFTSFEGFAIPYLAAPRLGLSAHSLAGLQGVLLLTLGLVWPKLSLGETASRIAFWLLIYSTFAILPAYVLGSVWGAGNETMPMAAGSAHGSQVQELMIKAIGRGIWDSSCKCGSRCHESRFKCK